MNRKYKINPKNLIKDRR